MIKTRLVGLLSHAKKYIVYTILWQWAALLSQVLAVFTIADLLERVAYRAVTDGGKVFVSCMCRCKENFKRKDL